MGTEVLRPYDVLIDRFPGNSPSFHRRRNSNGEGNEVVNRKQIYYVSGNKKGSSKPENKKKIASSPDNGTTKRAVNGSGGLVMGRVTLLRRGESLESLDSKIKTGNGSPDPKPAPHKPVDDLAMLTPVKIVPNSTEMSRHEIRLSPPSSFPDVYAGSAFYSSPSPRSLPLPSFFNKRDPADSATQDLRRLLRLD